MPPPTVLLSYLEVSPHHRGLQTYIICIFESDWHFFSPHRGLLYCILVRSLVADVAAGATISSEGEQAAEAAAPKDGAGDAANNA